MNVLELILGQLNQQKNVLESELERVVNNKDLPTPKKVEMSIELLSQISDILTTINLTNGYLLPSTKNIDNNN